MHYVIDMKKNDKNFCFYLLLIYLNVITVLYLSTKGCINLKKMNMAPQRLLVAAYTVCTVYVCSSSSSSYSSIYYIITFDCTCYYYHYLLWLLLRCHYCCVVTWPRGWFSKTTAFSFLLLFFLIFYKCYTEVNCMVTLHVVCCQFVDSKSFSFEKISEIVIKNCVCVYVL